MYKGNKKFRMQGKTTDHKNAIIKSLMIELIRAEKIKTTPVKARILKSQFDKMVTKAKSEKASGKNVLEAYFNSNERILNKFYKLVESNFGDRNSGFTHTIRTLPRKGDNAEQMYVMVVNYEEKTKQTKVQKLLERRKKSEAEKSVGGKLKKAVTKRTKKAEK